MTIKVRRVGGVLGVEVLDFALGEAHSTATWEQIRTSTTENCLLLFRGESISACQLTDFVAAIGPVMEPQSVKSKKNRLPEATGVELLSSAPDGARYAGQAWHSDYSYIEKPAVFSFFYLRKAPSVGGDTAFANMYAAYDALSQRLKEMLNGLEAVHSNVKRHQYQYMTEDAPVSKLELASYAPVKHPLVMTHPLTGRKSLYVSEALTTAIVGLPLRESEAILKFLFEHCARPEFVYRHVWQENDLVVIDNRCTNHCAVADYDMDEGREMLIVCAR